MNNLSLSVCVVDDDEVQHFIMLSMLQQQPLVSKYWFLPDAEAALDFLNSARRTPQDLPDVLLLDLDMNMMDGWEFLEAFDALRGQLAKKIRVFILSSSVDPRDIKRARSIDIVLDYLSKPLSEQTLHRILSEASGNLLPTSKE